MSFCPSCGQSIPDQTVIPVEAPDRPAEAPRDEEGTSVAETAIEAVQAVAEAAIEGMCETHRQEEETERVEAQTDAIEAVAEAATVAAVADDPAPAPEPPEPDEEGEGSDDGPGEDPPPPTPSDDKEEAGGEEEGGPPQPEDKHEGEVIGWNRNQKRPPQKVSRFRSRRVRRIA